MNKKYDLLIMGKYPPNIGGVSIHVMRLFHSLKLQDSLKVGLIDLNGHASNDCDVYPIRSYFKWVLRTFIKGFSSKILHYQGANYYGFIMIYLLSLLHSGTKIGLTIHGEGYINRLINNNKLRFFVKHILNAICFIQVGTENIKNQLENFGVNPKSVYVLDTFLPPVMSIEDKPFPSYVSKILNTSNKKVVLNAFNIHKLDDNSDLYGLHLFAYLAAEFNKINSSIDFIVLIAIINEKEYLEKLFGNLQNVTILNDNDIAGWKLISKCNLLVRPTSTDANAFSLKEAMTSGVKTLASDVVERYEGVDIFVYNDNMDLVKKTRDLLENDSIINLNEKDNVDKYFKMYESLLS